MFFGKKKEETSTIPDPTNVIENLSNKYKWPALGVGSAVLAILFMLLISGKSESAPAPVDYDPCCAYPCENDGICMSKSDNTYLCDCTRTGYYGLNCSIPYWSTWFGNLFEVDIAIANRLMTTDSWIWRFINRVPFLKQILMKFVYLSRSDLIDSPPRYESEHPYITLNAYFDEDYFTRTLPPVPTHCPTPMGIRGPKKLPPVDELIKKVFLRKTFKPSHQGSNLLFQYYAQHFTHQAFRTDKKKGPGHTYGKGTVDASNIYGVTRKSQSLLRSMTDGKLKTSITNGEEFPPYLRDCKGVEMDYPAHLNITVNDQFAMGNKFFAILPGLFMYATIWIREHNRVCDILKKEHPHWDDEQLYHTAKLIITGSIVKITIEYYIVHLSGYKLDLMLDPELIHGTRFQFHNRIYAEFNHLYHWHPLVPDSIKVNGTQYLIQDMYYKNDAVFKHGLNTFVKTLLHTRAGALAHHNSPTALNDIVLTKLLLNIRKLRYQGYNAYRRRFGLKPFKTFYEMTTDKKLAAVLEKLYGHVDAVEFYVGLLCETPSPSIFPLTGVKMGAAWSVKALMSTPICSPQWWKPSTFGGDVGFNIVNTASIKNLFCNNLKNFDACEDIDFSVPKKK